MGIQIEMNIMGVARILFFTYFILAWGLIALGFFKGIQRAWRSTSPSRSLWLYPLILSLVSTLFFVGWMSYDILTSRSSTAAIGWIFLPISGAVLALFSLAVLGALGYCLRFVGERIGWWTPRITTPLRLIGTALFLLVVGTGIQRQIARQQLLTKASCGSFDEVSLNQVLKSKDFDCLASLAKNPGLSGEHLQRIFDSVKDRIGNDVGSTAYGVFHALAGNPNTPPSVLAALVGSPDSSIRIALGTNPNTPVEVLPILAKDPKNIVRSWVTSHPQISHELLAELAKDPDNLVNNYARTALKRRGLSETPGVPLDPDLDILRELGQQAIRGDLKAIDQIEAKRAELYAGLDHTKDRERLVANLMRMKAAFDPLGNAAGTNPEAMKALEYADGIKGLKSFTVDAYGRAAAADNAMAMDALLKYQTRGWLLSSAVFAMEHPAVKQKAQAIDFLIAVLNNPKNKGLHNAARTCLQKAASNGSEKANATLEALENP